MKVGSEEKMMPLFWLHWLHADCDVCMVIRNHTGLVSTKDMVKHCN